MNKNGLIGREEATGRGVQYILREFFNNSDLVEVVELDENVQHKTL